MAVIPLLESGNNPLAKSPKDALGLWQFIPSTAKEWGLATNRTDDRTNVVKSTQVAIRYLKYLHNQLNDWNLALAAYNWGIGNVKKAIKKGLVTNNAINLKVMVEEIISIEKGENKSHGQIIDETLKCNGHFHTTDGKWVKIQKPDFMDILEKTATTGIYGLNMCVENGEHPTDLIALYGIFKNTTAKATKKVELNNEGNEDAKNKRIKKELKQLEFEFAEDKNIAKSWKNMKKIHIAKLKKIAFQEGFTTLQECGDYVNRMLLDNYNQIKKEIGRGVELIPSYINDKKQVNILWTNRWLTKMNSVKTPESMLEQFKVVWQ